MLSLEWYLPNPADCESPIISILNIPLSFTSDSPFILISNFLFNLVILQPQLDKALSKCSGVKPALFPEIPS